MAKINLKVLTELSKKVNSLASLGGEYKGDQAQGLIESIAGKIQGAIQGKDYNEQIGYLREIGLPIDLASTLEMYPNDAQILQDAVKLYLISKKAIEEVPKEEINELNDGLLAKYKDAELIHNLHNIEKGQAVNPENMERFVQDVVDIFTSQDERAQHIKQPLQKAMDANHSFKNTMIGVMLNSYMELEQQEQNKLADIYQTLFQKQGKQLLTPGSAIGTFLQNDQKRNVLKKAMQSTESVKTPQNIINNIDYSQFDLHLLGKMVRLSEEVSADLERGEGIGTKIQDTSYKVAKVCLTLIGIAIATIEMAQNIKAGVALVSGDFVGAFANWVDGGQYTIANKVVDWAKEHLEKLEKQPREEFIKAGAEVAKELEAVLTLDSKQKEVQSKEDNSVRKEIQPEYKKNLEKAESFVKHVQAGKEAATKLGQER